MQTAKSKKTTTGKRSKSNCRSAHDYNQTYGSDGPIFYWMKTLDEYRRMNKDMIFGISYQYLDLMVRLFLATHLATSKLIEDCRDGQSGNQVKLVPTSPNHPSRKFRVIQLWDNDTASVNAEEVATEKTVLTPFINRDWRASSRRRWPVRRKSPLKVDLVEETRKEQNDFRTLLEEVQKHRAELPEWERGADDGLDPLTEETIEAFRNRVRPRLHQKW